jgi:hypothetical protein
VIAVSDRVDSPTVKYQYSSHRRRDPALTVDSINLDSVSDDRLVCSRRGPVKCDRVGSNACEGHLRGIWDFNTENADELGNGFPKGVPCSPEEPLSQRQYRPHPRTRYRSTRTNQGSSKSQPTVSRTYSPR